jgi:hypothetical protein
VFASFLIQPLEFCEWIATGKSKDFGFTGLDRSGNGTPDRKDQYICSLLEIISFLFTLASQYFAAAGSGKDHIKIYRYHTFQITLSEAGRTEKHAKSTTQMQDKTKAAIAIM